MDRLTNPGTKEAKSDITIRQALDKLAEYEDLEEQGRLIRLPCKVGDTIWYVYDDEYDNYPIKAKVTRIAIKKNYILYYALEEEGCDTIGFCSDNFGKTIFLTQVEAEQKLKEMESDYNDKN